MRVAFLLVLAACGGSDSTGPKPLPVASLTGTYVVNLARVISNPANTNHSCEQVQVTLGASRSWDVLQCTNADVRAASVEIKGDSVILGVEPTGSGSLVAFRFASFTGSPDNARAEWVGGTCVTVQGAATQRTAAPCAQETGTAVWRR